MAGLEHLMPYIYHEKQQEGSMLCAQHALNSLLQDNYFAASDLSVIARGLDILEETYDDSNTGSSSTNMDDTGFFSVQVLDKALKVWGLNLTRWRSQDLRNYHDKPQTQLGFILNLHQHWFTLRRFGNASANIDQDEGNGHWFNLNSFLPQPEWVGKLYLGMVLQQAETEGYSVFAVTQGDPDSPLALPRTEADMIASTLPEPTSASVIHPERSLTPKFKEPRPRESSFDHAEGLEGFEDEDYQLQAALQASLMDDNLDQPPFPRSRYIPTLQPTMLQNSSSLSRSDSAGPRSGSHTPRPTQHIGGSMSLPGHADIDPVVASAERNKALLHRMKEEQEYAQREVWSGADLTPEGHTAFQARREQRQREEQEEAEAIQRAIEESKALAQRSQRQVGEDIEVDDENDGIKTKSLHTPTGLIDGNRVYDDDDAELQAALKASLEHMPPNHLPSQHSLSPSDVEDTESIVSDTTSAAEESASDATPVVSLDEVRRRRLARFGVQP